MNTTSRGLTYLLSGLYAALGAWMFLNPAGTARTFAWKVTEFQAMTIGAWCLGNAWLAYITARRWRWPLVSGALIYLWLFGILQVGVLLLFRDKLVLGSLIAWLYVSTLGLNLILALLGGYWWITQNPALKRDGGDLSPRQRSALWAFIFLDGLLGVYGLLASPTGFGGNAAIFPEMLTAFTLKAFGAFYLALSLGAVVLLKTGRNTGLHYGHAAYGLIVFITAASLISLRVFDFAGHPFQAVYILAYFLVGIPLLLTLLRLGTGVAAKK